MLSPVLEKIVDPAHLGKSGSGLEIDLVTVDTDVETAIAHEFKVCVVIPYNTRYLPVPCSLLPYLYLLTSVCAPHSTTTYPRLTTPAARRILSILQVTALPTVVAFKDGKPVNQFVGAVPEAAVRKFVGEL